MQAKSTERQKNGLTAIFVAFFPSFVPRSWQLLKREFKQIFPTCPTGCVCTKGFNYEQSFCGDKADA